MRTMVLFSALMLLPFTLFGYESSNRIEIPVQDARIIVLKSERKLLLYSDNDLVRSYKIGLGFSPRADKICEGDGATPEGQFRICVKKTNSKYFLSLGLNYPNIEDAERGIHAGIISRDEYQAIMEANIERRRPPWDTDLGGEIFIHGGGSSEDWTFGCIALNNNHMRELFAAVQIGTKVEIRP